MCSSGDSFVCSFFQPCTRSSDDHIYIYIYIVSEVADRLDRILNWLLGKFRTRVNLSD